MNLKTRAELLADHVPKYIEEEEARCYFRVGDIVEYEGKRFQIDAVCTGGVAYALGLFVGLRTCDDAKLLWRAV